MRTVLDLPDELIREVERITDAASPGDALVIAIEDFVRRKRGERVASAAGTLDELALDAPGSIAAPSADEPRPFGLCAGEFVVPADFDAPLPDEVLDLFEGR